MFRNRRYPGEPSVASCLCFWGKGCELSWLLMTGKSPLPFLYSWRGVLLTCLPASGTRKRKGIAIKRLCCLSCETGKLLWASETDQEIAATKLSWQWCSFDQPCFSQFKPNFRLCHDCCRAVQTLQSLVPTARLLWCVWIIFLYEDGLSSTFRALGSFSSYCPIILKFTRNRSHVLLVFTLWIGILSCALYIWENNNVYCNVNLDYW